MRSLLLGTRNPGKVIEIKSILSDTGWSFSSLEQFPSVAEAEENFVTFAENAIAKAQFYAAATGLCALADDSGLEVAALGGAPGVFSARYAGPNASDADRRLLLLSELAKTGATDRHARFVAVVAIAIPTAPYSTSPKASAKAQSRSHRAAPAASATTHSSSPTATIKPSPNFPTR